MLPMTDAAQETISESFALSRVYPVSRKNRRVFLGYFDAEAARTRTTGFPSTEEFLRAWKPYVDQGRIEGVDGNSAITLAWAEGYEIVKTGILPEQIIAGAKGRKAA